MYTKISSLLIIAGFIAILMLAGSGPLYRLHVLDLGQAFMLMRWAAYVGAATVVLTIIFMIWKRPRGLMLGLMTLATVAAFISFYLPYSQLQTARSVPPIHDITTDTNNPPDFVAIAPLRADAPNPVAYPGEETAEQQRQAYPDIETYTTAANPNAVFDAALAVTSEMGWELVASDSAAGRIEATATTTWFGFKDDVVIRIQQPDGQTEVDVRSKSRVGRSDVGANAERIRTFINKLDQRL
ncbi:DUF1499 domain-containing protein [Pseudidiomarina sp.]|uniref:DUF1499 domain-containing protein n=1 Tax=Pseudidiomarina sp. TaxID=2081707 RepID=UPI00299EB618|nr:DUF1499 domain-containing protein [Pseudidiomarina sp.]MDX1705504.1 DUF1499 domain-containing protein [Pseudidiomarina sp.]